MSQDLSEIIDKEVDVCWKIIYMGKTGKVKNRIGFMRSIFRILIRDTYESVNIYLNCCPIVTNKSTHKVFKYYSLLKCNGIVTSVPEQNCPRRYQTRRTLL